MINEIDRLNEEIKALRKQINAKIRTFREFVSEISEKEINEGGDIWIRRKWIGSAVRNGTIDTLEIKRKIDRLLYDRINLIEDEFGELENRIMYEQYLDIVAWEKEIISK